MGTARVTTDSPAVVLAGLRQHRAAAEAHEVAILETAATWADLHPPESVHDAAYVYGTEGEVAIAGEGAPLVAEFACAELAGALGIPTEWGTRLMGDALERRHRLPRLWARATGGDLPVWRARRIAQSTRPLSRAAVAWVDAQVAPFAHRIGPAQTDRLVEAAVARFDPSGRKRHGVRPPNGASSRSTTARSPWTARLGSAESSTSPTLSTSMPPWRQALRDSLRWDRPIRSTYGAPSWSASWPAVSSRST